MEVIEVPVVDQEAEEVISNKEEVFKVKNKLYVDSFNSQEDAKNLQNFVNFFILKNHKHKQFTLNFSNLKIQVKLIKVVKN